jgi:hypothetical protein
MPLNSDLREFVELLNSHEVEYVIVGAFAVAWHGYPRYTADLDIFINAETSNALRVKTALERFGFSALDISIEDLSAPGKIIQLGVSPNRIDILTSISGVSFEEVWKTRATGQLDGIPVYFIGRESLLYNKEATGRARDLGDAEELRKRSNPQ